ncbi:MAG: 4Fe-4S binding protein [Prevotellaceae bacterium]|jgi:NADH-quinone oxidoreductase subunit I|nr:4Fe-4S binding protein [Prevotellaceae bacterium]
MKQYFLGIFTAIKSLLTGMGETWKELWTKKVTQEYPENRKTTLFVADRWRAVLTMPHDENNEHACTACGICQSNCPNGTIQVISKMIETEDGKKKKILDAYLYDLGSCTFCNLCTLTCPSDAITFSNNFENAVYNRENLKEQLNKEGSKLREKKKPEGVLC